MSNTILTFFLSPFLSPFSGNSPSSRSTGGALSFTSTFFSFAFFSFFFSFFSALSLSFFFSFFFLGDGGFSSMFNSDLAVSGLVLSSDESSVSISSTIALDFTLGFRLLLVPPPARAADFRGAFVFTGPPMSVCLCSTFSKYSALVCKCFA